MVEQPELPSPHRRRRSSLLSAAVSNEEDDEDLDTDYSPLATSSSRSPAPETARTDNDSDSGPLPSIDELHCSLAELRAKGRLKKPEFRIPGRQSADGPSDLQKGVEAGTKQDLDRLLMPPPLMSASQMREEEKRKRDAEIELAVDGIFMALEM